MALSLCDCAALWYPTCVHVSVSSWRFLSLSPVIVRVTLQKPFQRDSTTWLMTEQGQNLGSFFSSLESNFSWQIMPDSHSQDCFDDAIPTDSDDSSDEEVSNSLQPCTSFKIQFEQTCRKVSRISKVREETLSVCSRDSVGYCPLLGLLPRSWQACMQLSVSSGSGSNLFKIWVFVVTAELVTSHIQSEPR